MSFRETRRFVRMLRDPNIEWKKGGLNFQKFAKKSDKQFSRYTTSKRFFNHKTEF